MFFMKFEKNLKFGRNTNKLMISDEKLVFVL